jgi:hypothetical protein
MRTGGTVKREGFGYPLQNAGENRKKQKRRNESNFIVRAANATLSREIMVMKSASRCCH